MTTEPVLNIICWVSLLTNFDHKHKLTRNCMRNSFKKKEKCLIRSISSTMIPVARKYFYNAYRKPHCHYASIVWDGCGEVHLKELNFLNRRVGKLIVPDFSPSTQQTTSAAGTLNLLQQLSVKEYPCIALFSNAQD